MAWMCQDWPDSRPTRAGKVAAAGDDVFDYPLPRPDYADLCNYGADRPFASHLAGDWNNPQSKQLWERAVGKLSSAMTTLIRDTYEWYGSIAGWEDFELHLPDRPFRPVETSIGWRPLTYQSTDLHPVVESREMLWYAIGDGAQEE